LLNDILNPNAAIDANYIEYSVTLKNGRTLNGIIVTETGASITLKRAQNVIDTVLRQDVDDVQSTGRSLMPEGLEKAISVAEMTDLLSFLKNWRYLDGSVPLGAGK
jgi:putative heme-binding domain-containing protein